MLPRYLKASLKASRLWKLQQTQKNYRMKQSWRQASMQVLNSSVARPWKLEQNTSGQASRQALRASRLWKLEQNNMTKKGPFFGPQTSLSYCFAPISIALRPSRPAAKPALTCFVLISMVLRHWSSRLALRPASNFVSSYNFFGFAAISITLRP